MSTAGDADVCVLTTRLWIAGCAAGFVRPTTVNEQGPDAMFAAVIFNLVINRTLFTIVNTGVVNVQLEDEPMVNTPAVTLAYPGSEMKT
jgi:hypothetical protein